MIFVVDACVACSMGGPIPNLIDPIPKKCRDTLMEIYFQSHEIAISEKILEEYRNNASSFFREWLTVMISKSRVKDIEGCEKPELRDGIKKNVCCITKIVEEQQAIIDIVLKDVHLLEVALVTHNFIISNDNRSRNHLIRLMKIDDKKLGLTLIIWATTEDDLINWIKNGADIEKIPQIWNLDNAVA